MLQAELKILGGKHQGKLIPLTTKKFLVGREQDCHLRPNSDLVSRHHCVFSVDDYSVRLRDLGSTNGTLVNGVNLRGEVILKSGDRVSIGKLELEVLIRQASPKSATPLPQPIPEPALPTQEMPLQSEEAETSYELATFATPPPSQIPAATPADTAIIGTPPPQYLQPAAPGYPPGYPSIMPPGYQMPGAYMPPQYPGYPSGFGQPAGYAPHQLGYPMGYPQMMPMQQGYPGVAVASPTSEAPSIPEETPAQDELAVKLPNPDETGAKPANPTGTPGAAGAKKEDKPSTTAADIIKQYMSRRS